MIFIDNGNIQNTNENVSHLCRPHHEPQNNVMSYFQLESYICIPLNYNALGLTNDLHSLWPWFDTDQCCLLFVTLVWHWPMVFILYDHGLTLTNNLHSVTLVLYWPTIVTLCDLGLTLTNDFHSMWPWVDIDQRYLISVTLTWHWPMIFTLYDLGLTITD